MVGRPTVMTEKVIEKLEEAFAWGCTDREACLWANIAVPTLYLYQEKHPEFIERKEALKDTPILNSRTTVANAVKRDPDMAMKYLERKKKDEFSTKTENDVRVKELPKPIMDVITDAIPSDDSNQED